MDRPEKLVLPAHREKQVQLEKLARPVPQAQKLVQPDLLGVQVQLAHRALVQQAQLELLVQPDRRALLVQPD